MKIGWHSRILSDAEWNLVHSVFGMTVPAPPKKILLDDGLGLGDRPWTEGTGTFGIGVYSIHVGPVCYPDCTSRGTWAGFGRIDTVFIHEMTHVWQYFHGYNVKLSSVWGQSLGDGYEAVPGKAWNDYNVEQQASLVEDWYTGGMSAGDDRFPYIEKVLRKGGGPGSSKTLTDLKAWAP